ncbi:MAG: hypothetical protein ACJAWQ_001248, partial [Paraglaciecola sp.]
NTRTKSHLNTGLAARIQILNAQADWKNIESMVLIKK